MRLTLLTAIINLSPFCISFIKVTRLMFYPVTTSSSICRLPLARMILVSEIAYLEPPESASAKPRSGTTLMLTFLGSETLIPAVGITFLLLTFTSNRGERNKFYSKNFLPQKIFIIDYIKLCFCQSRYKRNHTSTITVYNSSPFCFENRIEL